MSLTAMKVARRRKTLSKNRQRRSLLSKYFNDEMKCFLPLLPFFMLLMLLLFFLLLLLRGWIL